MATEGMNVESRKENIVSATDGPAVLNKGTPSDIQKRLERICSDFIESRAGKKKLCYLSSHLKRPI